ncbi:High-affinity methionine permease [Wickerhamiella sorbophila]|uniref:High-affinity methionine permease n=1 Tax=Wickerhamiella sorbophila TaxID=45607 RepID=A0A2T0FPV8_9ASCO|nr:High-affinity methionine permease [Wickerhamiella sorbophila]PRT57032.1 High-affinity methionine permease [Wickerhamiella sorbophila]
MFGKDIKGYFSSSTSAENSSDASEVSIETGNPPPENRGVITPEGQRSIGMVSAIFLILNRIIGTGIFATPATIYSLAGSVGLSLILWAVGSLIALSGLMVYMEWGSQIPKNGGEKNYLEYFYRKPKFLALCCYAAYAFLLGWAASNSVVFGEYILVAAGKEVTRWNQRGIGVACLTFSFLLHGTFKRAGLALQNVLGLFKLVVIGMMIIIGFVALGGGGGIKETGNFHDSFTNTADSTSGYGVVMALYNIIWSFVGYSNANYALAEAKNPNRILKYAAPTALISVAILYMLVNIAYFAVVPLDIMKSSGRIVAAEFFRVVWGEKGAKALSVFVALSALGNVLAVIYSQGRIVQELGREGVLPFSQLWATSRPFNTPFMGLFEHWGVSMIILLAPPPGDAYNFILNLISYPLSVVNAAVSFGLIVIYLTKDKHKYWPDWDPPLKATLPVAVFFFLASLYLVAAPFIPPDAGQNVYESLPYYLHCVVGLGLFGGGFIYWLIFFVAIPYFGGYRLESKCEIDSKGWPRNHITRVYDHEDDASTVGTKTEPVISELA